MPYHGTQCGIVFCRIIISFNFCIRPQLLLTIHLLQKFIFVCHSFYHHPVWWHRKWPSFGSVNGSSLSREVVVLLLRLPSNHGRFGNFLVDCNSFSDEIFFEPLLMLWDCLWAIDDHVLLTCWSLSKLCGSQLWSSHLIFRVPDFHGNFNSIIFLKHTLNWLQSQWLWFFWFLNNQEYYILTKVHDFRKHLP